MSQISPITVNCFVNNILTSCCPQKNWPQCLTTVDRDFCYMYACIHEVLMPKLCIWKSFGDPMKTESMCTLLFCHLSYSTYNESSFYFTVQALLIYKNSAQMAKHEPCNHHTSLRGVWMLCHYKAFQLLKGTSKNVWKNKVLFSLSSSFFSPVTWDPQMRRE